MNILSLQSVSKKYPGQNLGAVLEFSLEIVHKELMALVGESGSGKTTILRLIAGFEFPDSGSIALDGQIIAGEGKYLAPEKREIGLVFQDFALFPHMNVFNNIAFGISSKKKHERMDKVNALLELVKLKNASSKYPHQLSGGEQQRVALARSLAPDPKVLLLDEPFSNLDEMQKFQMRSEIKEILQEASITTILVTHDTKDALAIADRISIIQNGKLLQVSSPSDLYENPHNGYVSNFFGTVNILNVVFKDGKLISKFGIFEWEVSKSKGSKVCVRPEDVLISDGSGVEVVLNEKTYAGDHYLAHVSLPSDNTEKLTIKIKNRESLKEGDRFFIKIDPDKLIHIVD